MKINIKAFVLLLSILISCGTKYSPKPRGYFRINLPEKEYLHYESEFPYTFDYPKYAKIQIDDQDSCWINILLPEMNGEINFTYKKVNNNIADLLEDSRTFVNKHIVKADAIDEKVYESPEKKVFGIMFDIKGNAATPVQFFLTDSTSHFLRGSLIFNAAPNKDSLAPVIDFVRSDIVYLMESLEWKKK